MRARPMNERQWTELEYMIHHIFLPPKLPGSDDSNPHHEKALMKTTIDVLQDFKNLVKEDCDYAVEAVIRTIRSLYITLDSKGHVDEDQLSEALQILPTKGSPSCTPSLFGRMLI